MFYTKLKNQNSLFFLTFFSYFSTLQASTFSIQDQIKSIDYGSNPHFSASVRIVNTSPLTTDSFVRYLAHPEFTEENAHEMGVELNQKQLVHMKECILESGGAENFLLKNQDKIKCETTSERMTIKTEEGIFDPQYNLSAIRFPEKHMETVSTATIIDVQSIGLPCDLQRRVFVTCTHPFMGNMINREILFNQLEHFAIDAACKTPPDRMHRPIFKRYKIESLFYAQDDDIAFGILDTPVDEHITPLSVITTPLKLEEKCITIAGYGSGSIRSGNNVSEYTVVDDVKRAGHEIIKEMLTWTDGGQIECYPFEKSFHVSKEIIPSESIPLKGNGGHGGSGGLLWNSEGKKFEVIGVLLGSVNDNYLHSPIELGINSDPTEYKCFETYCQAIEEKILPEHEGKMIRIRDISKNQDAVREILNGKIIPISYPDIKFVTPSECNTFVDYSNKLKKKFGGMKNGSRILNGNTGFLPVFPYISRFVKKFNESDYLKRKTKGVYKI